LALVRAFWRNFDTGLRLGVAEPGAVVGTLRSESVTVRASPR
jgi:hypothetical protein